MHSYHPDVVSYAPSPGIPELISGIQRYYARLGVNYDKSDIMVTHGGSEALSIVFSAILNEGDEVLVPEPFYANYKTFTTMAGGKTVPVVTKAEDGYQIKSREQLEACITPRTRAILFTNPSNPTGVVMDDNHLRMLADVAKEHDLFLVADEVYREFVYEGKMPTSMGSFLDVAENTVIIDSISKRFSACGARIGCVITRNKQLQEQLNKLVQGRLAVATINQVAATALYNIEGDYFAEAREEYRRRRDTICEGLNRIPGVKCMKPAGAFYLMATLPVPNTDDFQTWLLTEFEDNKETLMYAPGSGFYSTPGMGVNEVRMAYVLNTHDLERSTELLRIALERYPKTMR